MIPTMTEHDNAAETLRSIIADDGYWPNETLQHCRSITYQQATNALLLLQSAHVQGRHITAMTMATARAVMAHYGHDQ